jgi:DNA-binding beta-propeller fold protein YncE
MANCNNIPMTATCGCPECDIHQLARNHYFTGKLLVERDFTDEQRYTMGKLRRHNQRLHGWGTVCGLKVKKHPNPACQSQYVVIDPGTAIDCCGREILVTNDEYFDFQSRFLAKWQEQNSPTSTPDSTTSHTIQICASYKECPTENVPALFDDCSGDTGSCQPNRILESYAFDVLIDPSIQHTDSAGVRLDWFCTVGIQNPLSVAKCDFTGLLYVLASNSTPQSASLYAVDTANNSVVASQTFAQSIGLDVAVSTAGDFVYVALQPTTPSTAPQILVLNTEDLTTPVNTLPPGGTHGDKVRLAVVPAPDNRLLAVFNPGGGLFIWTTAIQTKSATTPSATPIPVGTTPVAIAVNGNGSSAYVANSDGTVSAITLSNLFVTSVTAGLAGATSSAIAVATTAKGDIVAVLDKTKDAVSLIAIPSSGPTNATQIGVTINNFTHPPVDLKISPGGRWVYVLEQDAASPNHGYVQTVDEHAVELVNSNVLGAPVPVGLQPVELALSPDGSHLYIPYSGNGNTIPGAVAVLNFAQADCPDIFREAIELCPDCSQGNCIVLATITGYKYGDAITDAVAGKAPGDDQIDNLTDRQILVSTDLLTRVVRCLLDQGAGGGTPGEQGPVGPAGTPGAGITSVKAAFVACDVPPSASLSGPLPNQTLNLTIPGPCNPDLVGIQAISWTHGGVFGSPQNLLNKELSIAFTAQVQFKDISQQSVQVLVPTKGTTTGMVIWAELTTPVVTIQGGSFASTGNVSTVFTAGDSSTQLANGLQIKFNQEVVKILDEVPDKNLPVWVRVRGDFIRDASQAMQAVDGDHLPPWLPTRSTGDGIEGGTFESWFTLTH